jgi:hypothetical protein
MKGNFNFFSAPGKVKLKPLKIKKNKIQNVETVKISKIVRQQ